MKIDLHTHSTASDGALEPTALVACAVASGVAVFSITDHDTLAAYDALGAGAGGSALRLVRGVELTVEWRGQVVHILGYGFDAAAASLRAGLERQHRTRELRAELIGERLARRGIFGAYEGARREAGTGTIGRPHFARHLVAAGVVRSVEQAFVRYLGDRALGRIPQRWASLSEALAWIAADGGVAVLAHPAKYAYTHARLRELIGDFIAAGGRGLEVRCGRESSNCVATLIELCRRYGLEASAGSDFHAPSRWLPEVGVRNPLPPDVPALWARWSP